MKFAIVNNGVVDNIVIDIAPKDNTYIACDGLPAYIGGTYSNGVFLPPVVVPDIPSGMNAKDVMWERIKAERDRRKLNGVFVSGKWIHTDTFSRTQWMAMFMMGASIPVIPWTTMDYSTINTSQTLAAQVFNAVAQMDATLFSQAAVHRAAMEASANPLAYDFSSGWQATFEG